MRDQEEGGTGSEVLESRKREGRDREGIGGLKGKLGQGGFGNSGREETQRLRREQERRGWWE